jgi:hypothetical protein
MSKTAKLYLLGALLAAFLAAAQLRTILLIYGDDYWHSAAADAAVTTGHPIWLVFQNRVLGPWLIQGLAVVFPTYRQAHAAYTFLTLALAGFLAWRFGLRHGGSAQSALLALVVFETSYTLLLSPLWLYAWDNLDVIFFFLLVDFVLSRAPLAWFVGLYAVAIFNRDSAQFIALWMMVDPCVRWLLGPRGKNAPPFAARRFAAGAACAVAGAVVIEILRRTLLVEEIGPALFPGNMPPHARYAVMLSRNLADIGQVVTHLHHWHWLPILFFLALAAGLAVILAWRNPARYLSLGLVELALIGALLVFALTFETRVYLELIPFIVLAAVALTTPEKTDPHGAAAKRTQ